MIIENICQLPFCLFDQAFANAGAAPASHISWKLARNWRLVLCSSMIAAANVAAEEWAKQGFHIIRQSQFT